MRLRTWIAVGVATAAALALAPTASAAAAAVTACSEIPLGYAITFNGSGFAPNAVVSGYDNGSFRGITTADSRGRFFDFNLLVFSLPSEVSFVDTAGNTAVVTVTSCPAGGGGGEGGGGGNPFEPETKDDCKQGGWDPAFKNQGRCVSTVASKNK